MNTENFLKHILRGESETSLSASLLIDSKTFVALTLQSMLFNSKEAIYIEILYTVKPVLKATSE